MKSTIALIFVLATLLSLISISVIPISAASTCTEEYFSYIWKGHNDTKKQLSFRIPLQPNVGFGILTN